MSDVGQNERATQDAVLALFQDSLGYRHLGDLRHAENRNVHEDDLRAWLEQADNGHSDVVVNKAINDLVKASRIESGGSLRETNRRLYTLLRYGVSVVEEAGKQVKRVHFVDWKNPENNDFAVAEEVTVAGKDKPRRPDVVLYVNGIALGVLELKRSTVSVGEGVRQNIGNQSPDAIAHFFTTAQLVMAGNTSQGLRYGTAGTPEEHYLVWREESEEKNPLHRSLLQLCRKSRLLEIVHDFIVFDSGVKKLCRHNQYFGVKRAQERVGSPDFDEREGGIIWHTQGSGKSLTMVWLARWLKENTDLPGARVLIITDRTELDEQIESVFKGVEEEIYRTRNGADLVAQLGNPQRQLVCSLIQKFGRKADTDAATDEEATASYLEDLKASLPEGFRAEGDFFVFIDECHRTQSGGLHAAMKSILGEATFIGFTGTPLLEKDKQTSMEVFGGFIHTYKYDEAVRDHSVLDLRYEARNIDQSLLSPEKVDEWFEEKTGGLTAEAKGRLKKRWATIKNVHSAKERLARIADDILIDMETRPRLVDGRGNAMVVTGSIYQAFKLYQILADKGFGNRCAVVSSYSPIAADTGGSGDDSGERQFQYDTFRRMISTVLDVPERQALSAAANFERTVKERFKKEPGEMRLLIVVDKLLTGFDAPSATYLYIDKKMQDHGLFQAICRVNRLDGEDKEFGYIIDYVNLFPKVQGAVQTFTNGAFDGYDPDDVDNLLSDRMKKARSRLDDAREKVRALCEPVPQPKSESDYIAYFCADDTLDTAAVAKNEPKRQKLYRWVSTFVRAYASIANEMPRAGYTAEEATAIKKDAVHYQAVKDIVRLAADDRLDLKVYEPDMRQLLDTYIDAGNSEQVASFEQMGLVDLLAQKGEDALKGLPAGGDDKAVSATIELNIRKVITDEQPTNPEYYAKMSESLERLITRNREDASDYKTYLYDLISLAKEVKAGNDENYPPSIANSKAKQALYDNLERDEELALSVHQAVEGSRKAKWLGNIVKENQIKYAIGEALQGQEGLVEETFEIVKSQPEYRN